MPIHDWTRVDSGLFHAFHQTWVVNISNALNGGLLPDDHYALPEQSVSRAVGDPLPAMPVFLRPGHYVSVPLEATYQTSWAAFPNALKGLLQ